MGKVVITIEDAEDGMLDFEASFSKEEPVDMRGAHGIGVLLLKTYELATDPAGEEIIKPLISYLIEREKDGHQL